LDIAVFLLGRLIGQMKLMQDTLNDSRYSVGYVDDVQAKRIDKK